MLTKSQGSDVSGSLNAQFSYNWVNGTRYVPYVGLQLGEFYMSGEHESDFGAVGGVKYYVSKGTAVFGELDFDRPNVSGAQTSGNFLVGLSHLF